MSRANGAVMFAKDRVIRFFCYEGNADQCFPDLFLDPHEAWAFEDPDPDDPCECGGAEDVTICTDYGGGFSWEGKACRRCSIITAGLNPYRDKFSEINDGIPPWFNAALELSELARSTSDDFGKFISHGGVAGICKAGLLNYAVWIPNV